MNDKQIMFSEGPQALKDDRRRSDGADDDRPHDRAASLDDLPHVAGMIACRTASGIIDDATSACLRDATRGASRCRQRE